MSPVHILRSGGYPFRGTNLPNLNRQSNQGIRLTDALIYF